MKTKRKYTIANELTELFQDLLESAIHNCEHNVYRSQYHEGFILYRIIGTLNEIATFENLWNVRKFANEKHIDLYATT